MLTDDGKHLYVIRTARNGTVYAEQDDGKAMTLFLRVCAADHATPSTR